MSGILQRCLVTQVLVILEQGPRLELLEVVIQVLELLGAILDSLDSPEEDTLDSSLDKVLLVEDTQGLVPLAPLVATQEQVLQVEDIQALVPLEEADILVQEELHQEPPKVDILEALRVVLQVATQEVHLEATHLKDSRVPILEQLHLRPLTLRLDPAKASEYRCKNIAFTKPKMPPFTPHKKPKQKVVTLCFQVEQWFRAVDQDNSGQIDAKELGQVGD